VLLIESSAESALGGVVVPLEPHLTLLAAKLSLPPPDQLPLFPPMVVSR